MRVTKTQLLYLVRAAAFLALAAWLMAATIHCNAVVFNIVFAVLAMVAGSDLIKAFKPPVEQGTTELP